MAGMRMQVTGKPDILVALPTGKVFATVGVQPAAATGTNLASCSTPSLACCSTPSGDCQVVGSAAIAHIMSQDYSKLLVSFPEL